MKKHFIFFIFLCAGLFVFWQKAPAGNKTAPRQKKAGGFFAKGSDFEKKRLIVGSKIFTENIILAEILSLLLEEKYNFKVSRKFNMGGTKLVFDALKSRQIDIYPEYTGTGYTMLLRLSGETDPKKTYQIVKERFLNQFGLVWSLPLGFENTYALAVRKSDPRFKGIDSISQLKGRASAFRLGMGHEFFERKDGFQNFSKKYGLSFSKDRLFGMNPGLMYSALKNKEADMIMAYSTDGRIKAFSLKTLKDDKRFFPAYDAAYLTRADAMSRFPELKTAFKNLEGNISEREMILLNSQTDQLKHGISQTAKNFLVKKNILTGPSLSPKKPSLTAYYLSKKGYFFKIFAEHLILVFVSLSLAALFAIPMGVWMTRSPKAEKIIFAAINTLQTVPSLALLGFLIPILGIGFWPAICALFIYSLLPLVRNTFEGIKNVDASFIEAARGIGLSPWQILTRAQAPLALPVILAGARTSSVIAVGTAVLAAFIGAGGLGDPIFRGIATLDSRLIFLGAAPAAALAIALDQGFSLLDRALIPKGLKLYRGGSR